jgi:hypothetical protein
MAPFILSGSFLDVSRKSYDEIRVGDVVCFIGEDGSGVAHRVIRQEQDKKGKWLFVRGDAQSLDEKVPADAVVFVVSKVSCSYFSYSTDKITGRAIAKIALRKSLAAKGLFFGANFAFRSLLRIRARLKKDIL